MSQEIHDAWREGTSPGPFMDPKLEYVNPPDAVETGTLYGPSSFGLIRDALDDVEVQPTRFVDVGDEVLVVVTITGTSRGARVPVRREQGYIWTVRDGKAVRFRSFNAAEDALEAVGLGD